MMNRELNESDIQLFISVRKFQLTYIQVNKESMMFIVNFYQLCFII